MWRMGGVGDAQQVSLSWIKKASGKINWFVSLQVQINIMFLVLYCARKNICLLKQVCRIKSISSLY